MRSHGRAHAVASGFASVVGAGLIGIPAAVLHTTGSAAILTWGVALAVCIPMIVLLRDTVVGTPGSDDPLRSTITAGLGARVGDLVPLMFGLIVVVGLPVNASIAAHNLAAVTGLPAAALTVTMMALPVAINLVGGRLGSQVQQIGMVVLLVALIAVAVWSGVHPSTSPDMVPTTVAAVPAGVLLAFWAFVGFENLTFLAKDLHDARRDFIPVAMTTLVLLAVLAVGLTLAVASQLAPASVDPVTGLVDAATMTPHGWVVARVVAAAGALGVLVNAVVWLRGVGLVVAAASRAGLLPLRLDASGQTPRRAIGLLAAGSVPPTVLVTVRPDLVVQVLAAVSSVFVVIYLVTITAYLRVGRSWGWRLANLAQLPILVWSLWASGWWATYGAVALGAAAILRWSASARRSDGGPHDR